MEFLRFFFIFALLTVSIGRTDAYVPADVYWHSVLPNTPLPKALQQLLPSDIGNQITASLLKDKVTSSFIKENDDTTSFVLDGCSFSYSCTFTYGKSDIYNNNVMTNMPKLFFLYDELRPGKKMNLFFEKDSKSHFLPREIANSIAFSSDKLSEILDSFKIERDSMEARAMEKTIKNCEESKIKGEEKYCSTSLESLVDFGIKKIGKRVVLLSNEVDETVRGKKQEYTISRGIQYRGEKQMACHRLIYPYAVYYCHTLEATKAYMVPLVAADGTKAKALVVCHFDTSSWNSEHIAFQLLKVKAGGPPICHFFPSSDSVVWVPK